jgi:nucleoside-diphosphate-sugar epimerase
MILLLGADGFVGSAFNRLLVARGAPHQAINRDSYERTIGRSATVVINAATNSRKYLADQDWRADFGASVELVLRTLADFKADRYVLISSVDVYNTLDDPALNDEDAAIDPLRLSTYGFHKYLAEAFVRRHVPRWLIVRLAGMVGPGLKKNPVYDILNGRPLHIHPDSRYQFMSTDAAADAVWRIVEAGWENRVVNICGSGLISPRQIGDLAGKPLVIAPGAAAAPPRIVHVNTRLAETVIPMPQTRATIEAFVKDR